MKKTSMALIGLLVGLGVTTPLEASTNRPRVGVALGGGGALGFAHIGVLRVLEELRIPVDYIAGTSMGSIIAGLYASGMSPDEMEAWLTSLDWNDVMSDETPRRELFFRRKPEDQRYLFEMGLNFDGPIMGSGMAAGQKFNNLMQMVTLRSASITNFDELPIPYRAVATDLAAGQPYVIARGNLATAMRASMAVPGAFTPVELDGRVLVDGGVVENLPVRVVREMGADLVIAVDVGSASDVVAPEKLQTMGGILGRTYAVAQRPNSLEQLRTAEIALQPPLAGFTAGQFNRVAEIIPVGQQAARARTGELARLGVSADAFAAYLSRQRRPAPTNLLVSAVEIMGAQRVSESSIRGRIRSAPGAAFDDRAVNLDLLRVYGIGEFEQVLFRLDPAEDGTHVLRYDVREKHWGPLYLAYGLNLQSDFDNDARWAMLINVTRRSLNELGGEWRTEMELGSRQALESEFFQPLDAGGIVFVAPTVAYRSEIESLYEEGQRIADYDIEQFEGRIDLGVQLRHYAELRVGPVRGTGRAEVDVGSPDLPQPDEEYAGWTFSLTVDRLDRTVFAREGYYAQLNGLFAREDFGGEREYDKIHGRLLKQHSFGDHTLTATVLGGSSLNSDLPVYAEYQLGGPFGFAGLAEGEIRGSYIGVGSLGYRYRVKQLPSQLGRAVYALMRYDVGNVWDDEVDTGDLRHGAAVGVGVDSVLGPVYLMYGRADGGYDRFYLSIGTAF